MSYILIPFKEIIFLLTLENSCNLFDHIYSLLKLLPNPSLPHSLPNFVFSLSFSSSNPVDVSHHFLGMEPVLGCGHHQRKLIPSPTTIKY